MRIVEFVLRYLRKPKRNDPVFGQMTFTGDRLKYWECRILFAPTSSVVEAFVDGDAEDSMVLQRDFLAALSREWPAVAGEVGGMLVAKWTEVKSGLQNASPWDLFKLSSISIPKAPFEGARWEMSFAEAGDAEHLWNVEMRGSRPQRVTVDG